ncbi:peroxisome proliferator-activated receptor gamma coactivator-related protein 1-like [Heterodontus francisci]|uniref:peroxisome proliferator-activated receptor gamma coactivator-related protein 1-like n=1 Tax=Heterodontus francisci TaxID=7792 RepID=UPI00355BDC42
MGWGLFGTKMRGKARILNEYFISVFTEEEDADKILVEAETVEVMNGVKVDGKDVLERLAVLRVDKSPVMEKVDEEIAMDVVCMDFKKAFGKVAHKKLNKQLLDEESEATLLTALTEILDTVDDENPSPFDSIPDSEIFALPKGGRGCSLVGRQSCAVLPDSGKELFTHWVPAASKGPSTLWRLEKPKNRSFGEGISQQRSDGEEEDEDMINNGQGVSESGSELLDLHSGEQLNTPGLESGVTLLIGQNLPCGFNMKHVSLSDLVKYVHPYCLPMEAGTDSAGGVIELDVQVVQEGEVLDLEIPTVLCQGSECLPGGTVEIGTGLAAGKEPGPESQLQTLEQQEVLPAPPVQQESPPVLVRRRGRPRKTLKPTKTPVIGVQQDSTETPHSHSGLQTLLQTTENKKETPSEAQLKHRIHTPVTGLMFQVKTVK